ncbi:MAG TPA: transglycosylase domain-containing protein, partial [Flavobacteriales bacterium]|nr:transglycosylase domain-containing protein [Flavobacteriales bacterium]
MAKNKPVEKKNKKVQPPVGKLVKRLVAFMWTLFLLPFIVIFVMLMWARAGDMPTLSELENPQMNLASEVYSADNELLGKYFKENRSNVHFAELPQELVDCLVATEDERFFEHTGIDFRALGRAVSGALTGSSSSGGGSTITQQLAKMLFNEQGVKGFNRIRQKFKEWIIAAQIERKFSKQEIITMYLNKFDFLHNAVGIKSASRVYFNTTPDSLTLVQCAMLVGMAKNPSMFNPKSHPEAAKKRREVVLKQLLKNQGNKHIKTKLTREQYEKYRNLPLGLEYTKVDHVDGLAPYFREELRKELTELFRAKDKNGKYKIHKKDGSPYDVYSDGLKIYTTIDSRMQRYGEWAVREYLRTELQAKFDKDNKASKKAPFAYDVHDTTIAKLMTKALKQSKRYKMYTGQICSYCEKPKSYLTSELEGGRMRFTCSDCKHTSYMLNEQEIKNAFNKKVPMRVFSWKKPNQEFDTIMTPNDSIKYYMKF